MESMSKKEKLARGSAVIKVMRVNPRPGRFLPKFVDIQKIPRKPKPPNAPKGVLADMPWLDVKPANFQFLPLSARIEPTWSVYKNRGAGPKDPCAVEKPDDEDPNRGLPDGHRMIKWFGYREWIHAVNPTYDSNIADHFNILLGMLMSMAVDPENQNFPDSEAYPCLQFLKTIKTPDGEVPANIASLVLYIEMICQRMVEEG